VFLFDLFVFKCSILVETFELFVIGFYKKINYLAPYTKGRFFNFTVKDTELILPSTISACHELLKKQQEIIAAQAAVIKELTARIETLEDQVNKNSKNSNKPPASDGLAKALAFKRERGRRHGGKSVHKGKTLELVENPKQVVPLLPQNCVCGQPVDKEKVVQGERRQVFDLPEPKLEVTEYQKLTRRCAHCGLVVSGEFPPTVPSRVQYGSGVRCLTTHLSCAFAMPVNKIRQLFIDLFGYEINEGAIITNNNTCAALLQPTEAIIKERLLKAATAHSDESGVRVEGQLHWLHVFSSTLFTYFFVHAKRGTKALQDAASVLPDFKGWLVHDCWSSYFQFTGCKHALCGAHIIRELNALEEKGIIWAEWFRRYLLTVYDMTEQNDGVLPKDVRIRAIKLYDTIAALADGIEPQPIKGKRGRPKSTKGRNLLNRLVQHREAVLAFACHREVPFTNNLAERDLRPIKTKQKVSGCFRTKNGADNHARIYGFISTARKHQISIFNELKKVFDKKDSFIVEGC
jgi:transposase